MILSNVNCNFIRIQSDLVTALLADPDSYVSMKAEVIKNCCSNLTYNTQLDIGAMATWNLELWTTAEEGDAIVVNKIYFKNLITGIESETGLSFEYNAQNCTLGFATLQTDLNTFFGTLALPPPTATGTVIDGTCYLQLEEVPYPYVMTKASYTDGGNDYPLLFTYGAETGLFGSGGNLYLSPQVMGLDAFTDGIYTIKITLTEPNGAYEEETSCFFMDCTIKCKVAEKLSTLTTDSLVHIMYQALLDANNCACQCEEMCKLYEKLLVELGIVSLTSNCGCS
jgi:hypothetical protein